MSRTLARSELTEAIKGTAVAFFKAALIAAFHPIGVVVMHAQEAWSVVKWVQASVLDRGVDFGIPVVLGSGIEIDVSLHIGTPASAEEPPITACFGPASGPDPGVLVIDGCEISPGDRIDEKNTGRGQAESRIILVSAQISHELLRQRDATMRVAMLVRFAADHLVPALRRHRQLWDYLETERIECVIYYDELTKESIWLFFGEANKRIAVLPDLR